MSDKLWREDFLQEAWAQVRRNGGSAGVDGESFAHIEERGVGIWLGELARELKDGTYVPQAVRQVLIPKKQPGKFRPLGIPCIRDRVAQTAALLVLAPIVEADLQEEQHAYRPGRSANDAVNRVHSLLNSGRNEVVDADLSNYFGEIPHAELLRSMARRVSDGRLPGLVKAWLEMPVEEDSGQGGKRRTNRARRERKGTPQGAPISPLLSNLYMRRFILGWKLLGYARRFQAEIVNYADDFCVLGKAPAAGMLAVVKRLMQVLKLPINARKTRCLRCPEEPMEFPGYRLGRNYRPTGQGAYIGSRPSKASVQSICRKISEWTSPRNGRTRFLVAISRKPAVCRRRHGLQRGVARLESRFSRRSRRHTFRGSDLKRLTVGLPVVPVGSGMIATPSQGEDSQYAAIDPAILEEGTHQARPLAGTRCGRTHRRRRPIAAGHS